MRNKVQFSSKCGSVDNYVTKRLRTGTQFIAHVDFSLQKCSSKKFTTGGNMKNNNRFGISLYLNIIPLALLKAFETVG